MTWRSTKEKALEQPRSVLSASTYAAGDLCTLLRTLSSFGKTAVRLSPDTKHLHSLEIKAGGYRDELGWAAGELGWAAGELGWAADELGWAADELGWAADELGWAADHEGCA